MREQIKKIAIENFRVFKEKTSFEIRPLTFLIGPNNSGKSSFTKLLLAFKNDLLSIKFTDDENHNLESYDKILNWDTPSNELIVKPAHKLPFLNNNFCYEIRYKNNKINSIIVLDGEDGIEVMSFKKERHKDDSTLEDYNRFDALIFNFDLNYFIDLIYNKEVHFKNQFSNENNNYFNTLDRKSNSQNDTTDSHANPIKRLDEIILKLERNYLLFDLYRGGENITPYYKKSIIEHQNDLVKKGMAHYLKTYEMISSNTVKNLKNDFINTIKEKLMERLEADIDLDHLELKYSKLGALMFSEKSIIQKEFKRLLNDFPTNIICGQPIYYVSANRGSQKRVLQNTSENQINEIIVDYNLLDKPDLDYLKEVLQIFDIEGELEIERFENTISCVYLRQKNRRVNLADLGFGYSQIIPVFLKIITTSKKMLTNGHPTIPNFFNKDYFTGITVIIEEPEANLHPNLQGKFADVLVLTLKKFPKINFIVETHSEYLIRKLQFLTARGDLQPKDSIIHYFNKDKYVSKNEPKVKQIFINQFGGLSDSFGPGFFDEATRLKFDLIKLQKPQMN